MEYGVTGVTIAGGTPNGVSSHGADARKLQEDACQEQNRRKELHFKASHCLLISFFLWIVYVVISH